MDGDSVGCVVAGERVRIAKGRIAAKHKDLDPRLLLSLHMQMFNGFYDIPPTMEDIRFMFANKPTLRHLRRMVRRVVSLKARAMARE